MTSMRDNLREFWKLAKEDELMGILAVVAVAVWTSVAIIYAWQWGWILEVIAWWKHLTT
jgi:hypothetical protein